MTSNNITLFVSADKFTEMVKLNVDDYVKNIKGADYLSHAHACWLMKIHFPSFTVVFETNERGLPFFEVESDHLDAQEMGVERGVFLACHILDLETGKRSATMYYPVMGNAKGAFKPSAINPTSRQVHDQMMRATARLIAQVTGIGYNLWLQLEAELLDILEGGDKPKSSEVKSGRRAVLDDDDFESVDEFGLDDDDDDFLDDDDYEEEEAPPKRTNSKKPSQLPRKPLSQRRR